MSEINHKQESVVRLTRLMAILGCLSTTHKNGSESLLAKIPEIRGLAFGRRTLQRDLNLLSEMFPVYHDDAVPRGYRLRNTVAGNVIQELAGRLLPYLRNLGEVPPTFTSLDTTISYRVYRAIVPSYPLNAVLHWAPDSEKLSSILAAVEHRDLHQKRVSEDYSGPNTKFKIVKIIEETLS